MKDLDRIQKVIASVCREEPAILAVYLFGSFAKGMAKESSDVDLAVLLRKDEIEDFSLIGFISALDKKLEYKTDVVLLNHADELLKFEVRKHGKLVFARSKEAVRRFEVMGRKTYEDFMYLHRRYVNSVLYGDKDGQSGAS
jgi:predicted nucleotidyltransferase